MAEVDPITARVMRGVSSNSPLPPSVETAYYRKCIELKRRINDIEENNDTLRIRKARINRAILKLRLERAMMLEKIGQNMELNIDDSDKSISEPHTPQVKPLRSKRVGQRSKATPPPSASGAAGPSNISPTVGEDPSNELINLDSSANDFPTQFVTNPYAPPQQGTPQGPMNGTSAMPPMGAMSVTPAVPSPRAHSYDPTREERRENGDGGAASGSRSGFAAINDNRQSSIIDDGEARPTAVAHQNGNRDSEMGEAGGAAAPSAGGFTAVNS
ncbi:hypothetical protein EJ08DRAFT_676073 [Tothia fuscella]|uniref:INO80 complex subunit F domain-containing protein n=1 Tax=Tothia fuscella TaxID=1048955 RepID=A0A9P4P0U7_9PEZI|nr:hypothetical protein EJ08DRAFT_676073 [Tothia fuscella]